MIRFYPPKDIVRKKPAIKKFVVFIRRKKGKLITRYFKSETLQDLLQKLTIRYKDVETITINEL